MSTDFFANIERVSQAIGESGAIANRLESIVDLLADEAIRREFFKLLASPDWIAPLQCKGFFKKPSITSVGDGVAEYKYWPASRYLARMAEVTPIEVAGILASGSTDNPYIIADTIDAALAMPARIATALVPLLIRTTRAPAFQYSFDRASELCSKLIDAGAAEAACPLALGLFSLDDENSDRPNRYYEHSYKTCLKHIAPRIAEKWPLAFIPQLLEWLETSIRRKQPGETGISDLSYAWRPAIEEHDQNSEFDFAGFMVGIVRASMEAAVQNGQLSLQEALILLRSKSFLVFQRIELHLICEFAEGNWDLAREKMLDRALFDDYRFKHEYARLLGHQFKLLSSEDRNKWLGWIDAGPDVSEDDQILRSLLNREPTQEERRERMQYWQFQRLHWIHGDLDNARAAFYQEMLEKEGNPRLSDLNVYSSGVSRWVSESPISDVELSSLPFEAAIEKVATWKQQERGFNLPDIEGLARTFRQYVLTNAESFSTQSRILISRPWAFIREFVDAMAEAVRAGRTIDASAVLALCEWVVQQPVDVDSLDSKLRWTRDSVGWFVRNLCIQLSENASDAPDQLLRKQVWIVIHSLYRDPPESYILEDVGSKDPRTHDYLDLGINSARGKAVEAGLEYARWIASQPSSSGTQMISGGFASMPEVREMIEWQIEPENRSIEALSVIGSKIGLIYWIDKEWLRTNASRLFDLDAITHTPPSTSGWAAWNAFLVWVSPHVEFYNLFEREFAYAVQQSGTVQAGGSRERPMKHLAEHLVILYGRGRLGLDDPHGVMFQFLQHSHPEIRRHAIGFVGRTMPTDEPVPPEVIERFMQLWDAYWSETGKSDAIESPDTLLFGTWFSCGKFPTQWALRRLSEVVAVAPSPAPDILVVERLTEVRNEDIATCMEIFDRIVRGDRDGVKFWGWTDFAKQIIQSAMSAGGEARKTAVELIDFLGRKGFMEFGELLTT